MDQQAFRSLLATPSNAATGEDEGKLPAAPPAKRVFGLAKRSREQGSSSSSKPTNLKPKSAEAATEKKWRLPTKNSATGDEYVDRAAARRTGKEGVNEFEEVERLREEFERRKEGLTEEEKSLVDEQMAFLGGDAKHSVLVKGLDFALLAQQRSRAAEPETADDDLEAAYAQASTSAQGSKDKLESLTPAEEELKKLERARAAGKFKPIGASKGFAPVTNEEAPEYIWKDGKRMRKKKKKPAAAESDATAAPSTPLLKVEASPSTSKIDSTPQPAAAKPKGPPAPLVPRKLKNVDPKTAVQPPPPAKPRPVEKEETASTPAPASPAPAVIDSAPAVPEEPDDSDEDIFAGASAWTGIPGGEDSDSDEEADKASSSRPAAAGTAVPSTAAAAVAQPGGKRDWFAIDTATPSEVPSLAAEASEADAAEKMIAASLQQRANADATQAAEPSAEPAKSGRLEGLSSSALPAEMSRHLLEREMEREKRFEKRKGERGEGKDEEQKRPRKRGKKGKGGGSDDE